MLIKMTAQNTRKVRDDTQYCLGVSNFFMKCNPYVSELEDETTLLTSLV